MTTPVTHYGAEWMALAAMVEMSDDPGASALHRVIDRALAAHNHDLQTATPPSKLAYTTLAELRITIDLDAAERALHDRACAKTQLTAGRLTVAKDGLG